MMSHQQSALEQALEALKYVSSLHPRRCSLAEVQRCREVIPALEAEIAERADSALIQTEVERLKKTLAASCDEQRQELYEAGPGGGCPRALEAEFAVARLTAERDAALSALRRTIRTHLVDDEAWDHEAETDRRVALALKEATHG